MPWAIFKFISINFHLSKYNLNFIDFEKKNKVNNARRSAGEGERREKQGEKDKKGGRDKKRDRDNIAITFLFRT